jgi:hypothetical protein
MFMLILFYRVQIHRHHRQGLCLYSFIGYKFTAITAKVYAYTYFYPPPKNAYTYFLRQKI